MTLEKKVHETKNCPSCGKFTFHPTPRGYDCFNANCGYSEPPKSFADIGDLSKLRPFLPHPERLDKYFRLRGEYERRNKT